MWRKRGGSAFATEVTQGRRKGARLGLLVAFMAIVPGLVAGTAYISSTTNGAITGTSDNAQIGTCGWMTAHIDSQITATTVGAAPTGGAVTFSFNTLGTGGVGGTGYEYLVDEFEFGCYSIPQGTTTVVLQICGAADPTATAAVSGPDSCGGGAQESIINADWFAMDTSVKVPSYNTNPSGGVVTCGTNEATGQAVATLYSQTGTAGTEIYYGNQPTLATGSPTASNDFPAGTDASCLPTAGYTVQAAGTSAGAVTLTALAATGTCTATTFNCGETLTFTDVCGTTTGCGSSTAPDAVAWVGFAMVDEQPTGMETCTSTTCTLGSNPFTGSAAFAVGWAMN